MLNLIIFSILIDIMMRIKICGITRQEQGSAIAKMGATDLGFICYPPSPRYISIEKICNIVRFLPDGIGKIGVFVNENLENIEKIITQTSITGVQLHGEESPQYCQEIRKIFPNIEIIKAFKIKNNDSLIAIQKYSNQVDTLLLDAYHPQLLGGTGKTLNWKTLKEFKPPLPWFLAGGLNPDNIKMALTQLWVDGIDLSSGVEISPGNKDLKKVTQLFETINDLQKKLIT